MFFKLERSLDEFLLALGLVEGGNTGGAVVLDTETASASLHAEEAHLTPVGAPRVSADPVLLAGRLIDTIANDGDFVVDTGEQEVLGVDTTGVSIELLGGIDTAGDGTVLVDLGLHLLGTGEAVVVGSIVVLVVDSRALVLAGLADGARRPGAVLALVDGAAPEGLRVLSDVLLARGVGDTLLVGELVDTTGVATLAGATGTAVDDDLGVEGDGSGVVVFEQDVETISEGAGGTLGPAGAAVHGDVLVLVPGEVVLAVNVSPVPLSGDVRLVELLPSVDGERLLTTREGGLRDTAATLLHEGLRVTHLLLGDGDLVTGVLLLLLSSVMLSAISPGVLWGGPSTVGLDG